MNRRLTASFQWLAPAAIIMAIAALTPHFAQEPTEPETFPTDPKLAPIIPQLGPSIMESVRAIHKKGAAMGARPDVFAKMGDSITAYEPFLFPIGDGRLNVDRHWRLLPVINRFLARDLGKGNNSFNRASHAGVRAWGAEHAVMIGMSPCKDVTPAECEINEIKPAFAIIMFGTNNVDRNLEEFKPAMEKLTRIVIAKGVVPVLSTIPDAPWTQKAAEEAHLANRFILELGVKYRIPVINYWRALQDLPDRGISPDGVHPSVAPEGSGVFTKSALRYGHNMRAYTWLATLKELTDRLD